MLVVTTFDSRRTETHDNYNIQINNNNNLLVNQYTSTYKQKICFAGFCVNH